MSKKAHADDRLRGARYRDALRLRVLAALGEGPIRAHAEEFCLNPETLRRWLRGHSTIPAWFVASVAVRRNESAEYLLLGRRDRSSKKSPRPDEIDDELIDRLKQIVHQVDSLWESTSEEIRNNSVRGHVGAGDSNA